jgi:hypothetical protein
VVVMVANWMGVVVVMVVRLACREVGLRQRV